MEDWPPTEQEERLTILFRTLEKQFKKANRVKDPDKLHGVLKDITTKLKEGKALIKEFEREARVDGMPAPLLTERRKVLADQLNQYISLKKELGAGANRDELFGGAEEKPQENFDQMNNQQLMAVGRRDVKEIDAGLARAERLVEDTEAVGVQAASALHDQTKQLNKIVDDLADIEFNVKKATKVITDITRGMLTDKCIGFLLFLAVGGVIAIIVLKVVNPNKKKIKSAIDKGLNATNIDDIIKNQTNNALDTATNTVSDATGFGRRMLREAPHLLHALLSDDDW